MLWGSDWFFDGASDVLKRHSCMVGLVGPRMQIKPLLLLLLGGSYLLDCEWALAFRLWEGLIVSIVGGPYFSDCGWVYSVATALERIPNTVTPMCPSTDHPPTALSQVKEPQRPAGREPNGSYLCLVTRPTLIALFSHILFIGIGTLCLFSYGRDFRNRNKAHPQSEER